MNEPSKVRCALLARDLPVCRISKYRVMTVKPRCSAFQGMDQNYACTKVFFITIIYSLNILGIGMCMLYRRGFLRRGFALARFQHVGKPKK